MEKRIFFMNIIDTAQTLIKFRTETGNIDEIRKCMSYMKGLSGLTSARIDIFQKAHLAPVFFARNTNSLDFDVLILGHIDVVPATDDMFVPEIKNGKLFGRGALDMKSFAAVALNSLEYVLKEKLPLKFGIILSSDEEKGSQGLEAFLAEHADIRAKVVLDNDVGDDISEIIVKCKNPVFVKIMARGKAVHGSTPWDGIDANEILMQTLNNIRRVYPYYSLGGVVPDNKWLDTVHFAQIRGGEVSNVISEYAEALCDFRLTENSSLDELRAHLEDAMVAGASYKIISASTPVVMSEQDSYIVAYKNLAEDILGRKLHFEYIGGATDSRSFAVRGSTVIMHSGSGEGMHAAGEYVVTESVEKLAEIQIRFLHKLALEK